MTEWPMVVTAYTRDTQYATLVTRLVSSVIRIGMSIQVTAYDPRPSWRHNVNTKRLIIREAVERFGSCLWIDADGMVVNPPTPVLESVQRGVSFAAYNQMGMRTPGDRIMGGTLYFGPGSLDLLDHMADYAKNFPEATEQSCLDILVAETLDADVAGWPPTGWGGVHWWPQGMCKIREHDWIAGESPVEYVRQFQGSRTGRFDVATTAAREQ